MPPRIYFDTSVWMAPYDDSDAREGQSDIVTAIERVVEWHENAKVEIVTSRQVLTELEGHLLNARTRDKAKLAMELMCELRPQHLPRNPADLGKAILGEMRLGVAPKFRDVPRDEGDREVTEYLTRNDVDFYVSLDFRHIMNETTKKELESRLDAEKSKIVTPQELVARLSPTLDREKSGL